jgi:hypothetical protein
VAAALPQIAVELTGERGMLARLFGSDVLVAMLARAAQAAAMGIAAILVISQMSAVDQGFFFAFISLGVLLQLCDFGLSYASLQAASHLLATRRQSELGALASRAFRINTTVTVGATLVVALLGGAMFSNSEATSTRWVAPWIAFVIGVGINHLTAPWAFLVEGGVSVLRAWRFRLVQETIAGSLLLVVMVAGFGLWSLVMYYWARSLVALAWSRLPGITGHFASADRLSMRRWRIESWSFQWRVGLGAVSNFLVFQAFGPILFMLEGPTQAGRFSLSLAVMNVIVTVTTAWPISQAAHFGVLLGRRDADLVFTRWTRLVARSTAFVVVGTVAAIVAFFVLQRWLPAWMSRFADGTTTTFLIAAAIAHHLTACFAVVLRSERRDPLLAPGIIGGVVTVIAMTIVAWTSTLEMVALAYLVCTIAGVPIAWIVYRRFARRHFTGPARGDAAL